MLHCDGNRAFKTPALIDIEVDSPFSFIPSFNNETVF